MTLIEKHITSKEITLLVYQERKKKQFYNNLDTNVFTENKTFWKNVKPFLTDKTNKTSRITLIEEERFISQDHLIVETFNEYSISIAIKNITKNQEYENFDSSEEDPFQVSLKNIKTIQVLR